MGFTSDDSVMGCAQDDFLYDTTGPVLGLSSFSEYFLFPVESTVESKPLVEAPQSSLAVNEHSANDEALDEGDFIALEKSPEQEKLPRGGLGLVTPPLPVPNEDLRLGSPGDGVRKADAELPPWAQGQRTPYRNPLLRLHKEIVEFVNFVTATPSEEEERLAAIARVSDVIGNIWPRCEVQVFGSYATGLHLPTSDCDVVVIGSGSPVQAGLRALAQALRRTKVAKSLQVIARAKVPIVKFVEQQSGISFDISFDATNGPEAAAFIKKAIAELPPLKPLCLVLKIFLLQRELNEVFKGGIGSYALLTMIIAHLLVHPSWRRMSGRRRGETDRRGDLEGNLGILLIDFLDLFGRTLNIHEVGISCRAGGSFYSKRKHSPPLIDDMKPYLLSVEDPQSVTNDLGKGSYAFLKVRQAFLRAHRLLTHVSAADMAAGTSLLGRIIRMDKTLRDRAPPSLLAPSLQGTAQELREEGEAGAEVLEKGGKSKRRRQTTEQGGATEEEEEGEVVGQEGGPTRRNKKAKKGPRTEAVVKIKKVGEKKGGAGRATGEIVIGHEGNGPLSGEAPMKSNVEKAGRGRGWMEKELELGEISEGEENLPRGGERVDRRGKRMRWGSDGGTNLDSSQGKGELVIGKGGGAGAQIVVDLTTSSKGAEIPHVDLSSSPEELKDKAKNQSTSGRESSNAKTRNASVPADEETRKRETGGTLEAGEKRKIEEADGKEGEGVARERRRHQRPRKPIRRRSKSAS
eukprot:TRINITY_DN5444_c0_g2_i1.p1 TRINITY_DN5444_c0_g2~~TRINITY_DN5444_c0_g2_i1.p1  ORF type:complete len:744 (-),score=129.75 TRINITY_DN5444_c0_g2_i1:1014-3245(-)